MTEWRQSDFLISTDKNLLDIDVIYNFLRYESYWAKDRPREIVEKSIENSLLCFGIYKENVAGTIEQVGFARVITDMATFAYLCDVFVVPEFRGIGLSKWLMGIITTHPELQMVRRMLLVTYDAHKLYAQYGFKYIDMPGQFMQRIQNAPKKIPYIIDDHDQDQIC